jgi:hypothetical protein
MMDIAAYHEAGHAIACLANGVEIVECWITDATPTPTGKVEHEYPIYLITGGRDVKEETYTPEVEAAYLKEIMIALAGEAAQRRYEPSSLDGDLESSLGGDRAKVQHLLACIKGSDDAKKAMLAECKRQVDALIEERWSEVRALANELIRRQRLTGAEVAALLSSPKTVT